MQDLITGFKGIVTCLSIWNNGCERIGVQPSKVKKDGKLPGFEWFDEPSLRVLKSRKVKMNTPPQDKPGGPSRPAPTRGMQ